MFGLVINHPGVACGKWQFFLYAQGVDIDLPGEGPVMAPARNAIPSISPQCTQVPRCCAQVIHTVVHSKPTGLMIEFAAARTYHGSGRGL